jgi:AP-2 complex subunit beta-1
VADKKDKGFAKKKTVLKKIVANMTMGNDSKEEPEMTAQVGCMLIFMP